jgi:hypothetical protein
MDVIAVTLARLFQAKRADTRALKLGVEFDTCTSVFTYGSIATITVRESSGSHRAIVEGVGVGGLTQSC